MLRIRSGTLHQDRCQKVNVPRPAVSRQGARSSDMDLRKGREQYENSSHVSHGFAEVGTGRTLPGFNYLNPSLRGACKRRARREGDSKQAGPSRRAFLFERSIGIETYDRHPEKLREELTLARIDRHSGQLEALHVEGILAFAERSLRRAADLWVQASLEQRQRFQQPFFPDGISFDGNSFVGTAVTAPAFSYLQPVEGANERLVDQNIASWNHVQEWLCRLDAVRRAA